MKDKRIEKAKKHYGVLINGKQIKVLNHFISQNNISTIRFITKIKGQYFPDGYVNIEIPLENAILSIQGMWKSQGSSLKIDECVYEITDQSLIRRD